MGIFKLFSSDSRDCGCGCNCNSQEKIVEKIVRVNSTPDPTKFTIKKKLCINGCWIFLVNYPDVKNYEGNKILMYQKDFNIDLIANRMDPHFFTHGDSPIARFEPTKYGWDLAQKLALALTCDNL